MLLWKASTRHVMRPHLSRPLLGAETTSSVRMVRLVICPSRATFSASAHLASGCCEPGALHHPPIIVLLMHQHGVQRSAQAPSLHH